ncbi:MAG TPA: hypothetical protein DHU63_06780 [Candidatus Marinimicrobia bacterium]|nr:hypothetical protein [Candidatus Neomarinimicrobiota bacterium]
MANASTDGEVSLTWEANTERDLAGYKLYRQAGADAEYQSLGTTTSNSYLDTGLDYDTNYYYKLKAYDQSGNESDSVVAGPRKPYNLDPPSKPTGLKINAYNLTSLKIRLQWNANNESDFAYYKIFRAISDNLPIESSTLYDSIPNDPTTAFYTYNDTGVDVSVTYYYRLLAYDKGNLKSNSSDMINDTPLPFPTLVAPADEGITTTHPDFEWQRVSGAKAYQIIVRPNLEGSNIWEEIVSQPSSGNPQITYPTSATGLTLPNTYYWKVGTFSQDDQNDVNSYSSTWSFTVH